MNKIFLMLLICLMYADSVTAQERLSDPTRPALYTSKLSVSHAKAQKSEFKVSQIYTDSKKRLATINGKKVTVGEWVDNARVMAINATSVSLLVDGEVNKISIMPSFKKYKK